MSTISSMRDKTKKHNTDKKKPGKDNLTLAIILVGCVLLCLFVLTGVPWIFKSIRRNCTGLLSAEDNDTYRLETVYVEINEQQESQDNTIGATVLTRSIYHSLNLVYGEKVKRGGHGNEIPSICNKT